MAKLKLTGSSSPLRFDAAHPGGKSTAVHTTPPHSSPPREHFIPLAKAELIDRLCQEPGLSLAEQDGFRRLCQLLDATLHFEYHTHFESLKNAYAPFDADSDTQSLIALNEAEKETRLESLFQRFDWLFECANFQRLSRDDLQRASKRSITTGCNWRSISIFSTGWKCIAVANCLRRGAAIGEVYSGPSESKYRFISVW